MRSFALRCFPAFAALVCAPTLSRAQSEAPPPGPPIYDPSQPRPALLPPEDPPYAEPEEAPTEDRAPGVVSTPAPAAPAPAPNQDALPQPDYPSYAAAGTEPTYAPGPAPLKDDPLHPPGFAAGFELLNVLPSGRLGVNLEFRLLERLSVALVPGFVTTQSPWFIPDNIAQHANALGPFAGVGINMGLWLSDQVFDTWVLRAGLTNYGYRYEATALENYEARNVQEGQVLDRAAHTERRLRLTVGRAYRLGYFTLEGDVGLELELNQQRRCLVGIGPNGKPYETTSHGCSENEFQLQRKVSAPNGFDIYGVGGPLYPVSLVLQLSIGFVFSDDYLTAR